MEKILIVEDDLSFGTIIQAWLRKKGFEVEKTTSVKSAIAAWEETAKQGNAARGFDLVLSDLRLPDKDGIFLLRWMREHGMKVPFIVMTSYAEIQNVVLAMKSGATDYIAKPFHPDILLDKIHEALNARKQSANSTSTPEDGGAKDDQSDNPPKYIEGESEASRKLYSYVSLVAPTPMSVLILGASGTGKEYVARRIHELSPRAGKPFFALDCGAIPKDVAASEFFGHVKGAYTGAEDDKKGAFEMANGGTLFLDEMGNLSYEVQVQLLRALQERKVRPLGSNKEIEVDIRLVCATNENLAERVAEGAFREDLFHRINEFTIYMPELKQRGSNIFLFADLFIRHANKELNRQVEGLDDKAKAMIASYGWPGNLRELNNVMKRATLLATGRYIGVKELEQGMAHIQVPTAMRPPTTLHDEQTERQRIEAALNAAGGNKSKAAQMLAVDRKTLYNKMRKYGM